MPFISHRHLEHNALDDVVRDETSDSRYAAHGRANLLEAVPPGSDVGRLVAYFREIGGDCLGGDAAALVCRYENEQRIYLGNCIVGGSRNSWTVEPTAAEGQLTDVTVHVKFGPVVSDEERRQCAGR